MRTLAVPPVGVSWVQPYLTVADAEATIGWCQSVFGFAEQSSRRDDTGSIVYAQLAYRDQTVLIAVTGSPAAAESTPAAGGFDSPVMLFVYVTDVDEVARRAEDRGADMLYGPMTMFWGDRIAQFRDPDGHKWVAATPVADETATTQISA